MKSNLHFYHDYNRQEIEQKLKDTLNAQQNFLSKHTVESTRATGDAIQNIISENFAPILGNNINEYYTSSSRRAMQDLEFHDINGLRHLVDVKTFRIGTDFSMPNLTSVKRLTQLYSVDTNYFSILKVDYRIEQMRIHVDKVTFVPIEFLGWGCLTIGALGWGQIQIKKSTNVEIVPNNSRKQWILTLCDTMLKFYPKEIDKISNRVDHFQQLQKTWKNKPD